VFYGFFKENNEARNTNLANTLENNAIEDVMFSSCMQLFWWVWGCRILSSNKIVSKYGMIQPAICVSNPKRSEWTCLSSWVNCAKHYPLLCSFPKCLSRDCSTTCLQNGIPLGF
jgi:hypothetical protein